MRYARTERRREKRLEMHVANYVNNARAKFRRRSLNTFEDINDTGEMNYSLREMKVSGSLHFGVIKCPSL